MLKPFPYFHFTVKVTKIVSVLFNAHCLMVVDYTIFNVNLIRLKAAHLGLVRIMVDWGYVSHFLDRLD